MDDLKLISRGLYRVVCEKLGTEEIVDMRRRVMAFKQRLDTASFTYDEYEEDEILSGSRSEGFRFASSDVDVMRVLRSIRVIFTVRENQCFNVHTPLQAECHTTKPGFALLRLLYDSPSPYITQACVSNGDIYLSKFLSYHLTS